MVKLYVPAISAIGFTIPQSTVKVPVPPLNVRFAVPSFPPLQLTSVIVAVAEIAVGSVMIILSV